MNLLQLYLYLAPLLAAVVFRVLSKPFPKIRRRSGADLLVPKRSERGNVLVPLQLAQVNPFYNRTRDLPVRERVKISIMAVTVFPFRIVGAVGCLLLACVVAKSAPPPTPASSPPRRPLTRALQDLHPRPL